jgi:hypothetical protein
MGQWENDLAMTYLFDDDDERAILEEKIRNQRKAKLISQAYMQQGKAQRAASWAKSADRIGDFIVLLKGAFQHKN